MCESECQRVCVCVECVCIGGGRTFPLPNIPGQKWPTRGHYLCYTKGSIKKIKEQYPIKGKKKSRDGQLSQGSMQLLSSGL